MRMVEKKQKPPAKKTRSDAGRNRQHLLVVAKSIFEANGSSASLEEIARTAGLGIGTLYRHFPTRDALIEAVYRNEREQLAAAASRLSATHPPVDALRLWMLLFVDFLATKHEMAGALGGLSGGTTQLYAGSAEVLSDAIVLLTDRAEAQGAIHLTLAPMDLLRAVAAVANVGSGPDWRPRARQLVDILVTGIGTKRLSQERVAEPTRTRKS